MIRLITNVEGADDRIDVDVDDVSLFNYLLMIGENKV
jgi:hypothetical protein